MRTDLRLALRAIRARPGFTLGVVLCIALGIGINSAIYSMVHAIVLRPLPYGTPDELVAVRQVKAAEGRASDEHSLPNFVDLRERSRTLREVAALSIVTANITEGDEPAGVDAGLVTARFFEVLGVRPLLGRTFSDAEGVRGAAPTVVIGHELWQQRFGGDPNVVGRTLRIDGTPRTVIGVMGERFAFTNDIEQLWLPLDPTAPGHQRGSFSYRVIGRRAPGATVAQVDAELRGIGARLAAEHPETNTGWGLRALALQDALLPSQVRTTFVVMLGAVTFVLLIACANVANLLLSRAVGRTREMAIRTSLGASRLRIARQLLTESVLLALVGGGLGVLVAEWGIQATLASLPFPLPGYLLPRLDPAVLAYTAAVAVASGLVFGLAPALQAGRVDPQSVLKEGGRGSSAGRRRGRLRDVLVAAQLALSLVLLTGAALMTKSFLRLQGVDPGFERQGVLTLKLYAGGDRFAEPARRRATFEEMRQALAALPGVERVAAVPYAPLSGWNSSAAFTTEDRPLPPGERPVAETRALLGDYFATLRIPVRAGRELTLAESLDSTSRVAVVSEGTARRHWPTGSPIGRRLSVGDEWLTVVGVVPDVRQSRLNETPRDQLYLPYGTGASRTLTFLVRTSGDPVALAASARRTVTGVDPSVAVLEVASLETLAGRSMWEQRVFGGMFGAFAVAALLLASIGLYGVIAYATSQRVHEFGVRIALGARSADVYRLVLGHGARVMGASLLVGLALSAALTRVLAGLLYGVSATDGSVFAVVTMLLAGVAFLATWLPARRATRVDPAVALRAD